MARVAVKRFKEAPATAALKKRLVRHAELAEGTVADWIKSFLTFGQMAKSEKTLAGILPLGLLDRLPVLANWQNPAKLSPRSRTRGGIPEDFGGFCQMAKSAKTPAWLQSLPI
jgi:hypothetical protein